MLYYAHRLDILYIKSMFMWPFGALNFVLFHQKVQPAGFFYPYQLAYHMEGICGCKACIFNSMVTTRCSSYEPNKTHRAYVFLPPHWKSRTRSYIEWQSNLALSCDFKNSCPMTRLTATNTCSLCVGCIGVVVCLVSPNWPWNKAVQKANISFP